MAGISAIILFIAFVLVAAVAAGLYIEYSGQLQSQAQETGEESQAQVSNQLYTIDVVGEVTNGTNGQNNVTTVHMNVRKASGADDIDMKQASIRTVHEDGSAVLEYEDADPPTAGEGFNVSDYKDDDTSLEDGIINSQSDRAKVTLVFTAEDGSAADALEPGEELTLRLTEAAGGTTTVTFTVPTSLDDKSDGETILLS